MSRFIPPFADVGKGITPSDGAQLFFFEANTSTPKNTFSDEALTIANTNPVISDSNGVFSDIWLEVGSYRVQLKDTNNVQKWQADPVNSSILESETTIVFNLNTLSDGVISATLVDGQALNIKEHTAGNGGGAMWDVVLASTVTPNTFNIVQCTGVPALALVLRLNGVLDLKKVGAIQGSDIASVYQAITDQGIDTVLETGSYIISAPVEVKSDFSSYGGRVLFDAVTLPANSDAVTSNGEFDIIGLEIDCANTTTMQSAFVQNLDFVSTRRQKFDIVTRNVTNLDDTKGANGVLLFLASTAVNAIVKHEGIFEAHNITATANGIIGDTGGSAQGVFISINGTGVNADVIWNNPRATKISPDEDADGIHIFDADLSNLNSPSKYVINNPVAKDCAKRGIKSQGPNIITNDAFIDLDINDGISGSALAYESLGVNNVLSNPVIVGTTNLTGDGSILASAANFTLLNPMIDVAAGQNFIRMGPGATNYTVFGARIRSTKTYTNNAFSMITVEGAASGSIDISSVNITTLTGSVARYQGVSGINHLSVSGSCEAETFVNCAFGTSTGVFTIQGGNGSYSGTIIEGTGDDGDYTFSDIVATTTGVSVCTFAAPARFTGFGKLSATTNGILYTGLVNLTGREISGAWKLTRTDGTGIGVDAGNSINARFTGIETAGFDSNIHINVNFSDKCVVTNNIGRGAGTHISTTSATNLINRDNDLIA